MAYELQVVMALRVKFGDTIFVSEPPPQQKQQDDYVMP
jgi:hypothetical protein